MSRYSKPRAGSLQFWPRKRAKRIYPRVNSWHESDKTKVLGFAAYKAGMAHAIITDTKKNSPTKGEEISVPITVLDCPPLKVLGVRVYEETPNGLTVLNDVIDEKITEDKDLKRKLVIGKYKQNERIKQIEKELERIKDVRIIAKTLPRRSGVGKKKPEIFEIGIGGSSIQEKWNYSKELIGKEINIKDIFKEGEYLDITAITKGKGTQGPVKRFGVKIQTRKAAGKRRHVGSLGSETPRRVIWTVPMAGQMGFQKRTEYNKRLLKMGEDGKEVTPKSGFVNYGVVKGGYVLIEGSLPGPKKRLIRLRSSIRPPKIPIVPAEIKSLSTKSGA